MKKTSIIAACVFVAVCIIMALLNNAVKSNDNFKVNYFQPVASVTGPDGRAPVGSEAVYQVCISPSLAWDKGDGDVRLWRNIAFILLLLTSVYAALAETGKITGSIHLAFVGFAVVLASYYAAYSSAFSNNYKELSPSQYEKVKDDPAALKALFSAPLIK